MKAATVFGTAALLPGGHGAVAEEDGLVLTPYKSITTYNNFGCAVEIWV